LGLASPTPTPSHLKLECGRLLSYWYTCLQRLSVLSIQKRIKRKFAVSACTLTYKDQDNLETVLLDDDDMIHF
jgi:hypothetical protein